MSGSSASALAFMGAARLVRMSGCRIESPAGRAAFAVLVAPHLLVTWWLVIAASHVLVPLIWAIAEPWRRSLQRSRWDRVIVVAVVPEEVSPTHEGTR
jgi:hypothetical protein